MLATVNTVSPIEAAVVNFVVACVVPSPTTAVIVEPVTTPVPLIGALKGGEEAFVKPIVLEPEGVIKFVVIVPVEPLLKTEKVGVPISAPE